MEIPDPGGLRHVSSFMASLTPSRIVLTLLFVFGAIGAFSLWEQRTAAMQAMVSSPLIFGCAVTTLALLLLGALLSAVIRYVDSQREMLHVSMRGQIDDLRVEVREIRLREEACTRARGADQERMNRIVLKLVERGALHLTDWLEA